MPVFLVHVSPLLTRLLVSPMRAITNHSGVTEESRARAAADSRSYLIAIGFTGDPTAFVKGKGGAQKKNSNTLSLAQSAARSLT